MNSKTEYFPHSIILDGQEFWIIWFCNGSQGLLLAENGRILSFPSKSQLEVYAQSNSINLNGIPESETPTDFDVAYSWLHSDDQVVRCEELLDILNLVSDLRTTIKGRSSRIASNKKQSKLYKKLFWGTNPPSMTPEGKLYVPTWSQSEIQELKNMLLSSIALFRHHFSPDATVGEGHS